MPFPPRSALASLGLAAVLMSPQAAPAADARNGERLAQRWCAACHVVAPAQRQATGEAPPFASIAARPGFSASQVAFFLLAPHPRMPDMSLTRREAEDLAAYIGALAPR